MPHPDPVECTKMESGLLHQKWWSSILPHIGVCAVQLSTEILVLKSKICQRANLPHRILFTRPSCGVHRFFFFNLLLSTAFACGVEEAFSQMGTEELSCLFVWGVYCTAVFSYRAYLQSLSSNTLYTVTYMIENII